MFGQESAKLDENLAGKEKLHKTSGEDEVEKCERVRSYVRKMFRCFREKKLGKGGKCRYASG